MSSKGQQNGFQFKKFWVEHSCSSLKVTTEACVLGAWAPLLEHTRRVLDLGTGSGLLALMLAQRLPQAEIHAIDIDTENCWQAQKNFSQSPFARRLHLFCADARQWQPPQQYDYIICNPPFFSTSLRPTCTRRSQATHTIGSLNKADLLVCMQRLLSSHGSFCLLYPPHEMQQFIPMAKKAGYTAQRLLHLHHSPRHSCLRMMAYFSKHSIQSTQQETLYIYESDGQYHSSFKTLLQPFYIIF